MQGLGNRLARELLAQVDPDLHAASAHGGAGDSRAVVDLGTEGVQRHATLTVPLTTAHLGTAETTGALDTDALGAGLAGGLDSLCA